MGRECGRVSPGSMGRFQALGRMSCFHSEVWEGQCWKPEGHLALALLSPWFPMLLLTSGSLLWSHLSSLFDLCFSLIASDKLSGRLCFWAGLCLSTPLPPSHLKQKWLCNHLLEVGGYIAMPDLWNHQMRSLDINFFFFTQFIYGALEEVNQP